MAFSKSLAELQGLADPPLDGGVDQQDVLLVVL